MPCFALLSVNTHCVSISRRIMVKSPWTTEILNMAAVPTCPHTRTILIAKDEQEEYLECLDCGEIFDVAERGPASPGFNETLSDA